MLCGRFGISRYPTMKYGLPSAFKEENTALLQEYTGQKKAEDIVSWLGTQKGVWVLKLSCFKEIYCSPYILSMYLLLDWGHTCRAKKEKFRRSQEMNHVFLHIVQHLRMILLRNSITSVLKIRLSIGGIIHLPFCACDKRILLFCWIGRDRIHRFYYKMIDYISSTRMRKHTCTDL